VSKVKSRSERFISFDLCPEYRHKRGVKFCLIGVFDCHKGLCSSRKIYAPSGSSLNRLVNLDCLISILLRTREEEAIRKEEAEHFDIGTAGASAVKLGLACNGVWVTEA
jgi:hypothetical protein